MPASAMSRAAVSGMCWERCSGGDEHRDAKSVRRKQNTNNRPPQSPGGTDVQWNLCYAEFGGKCKKKTAVRDEKRDLPPAQTQFPTGK